MSAIFATGVQQANSSITSAAIGTVWSVGNTSTTTYGPLGSQTYGNTVKDITIVNTGTATLYVGGSTVTSATGLGIAPGGQLTLQGYLATTANTTTGDVWGICASGGTTSSLCGMTSVVSVV